MIGRMVWIFVGLLGIGCSGRAVEVAPVVTVNGFFEQATLRSGALRAGETQELHLVLQNGGGSETIFQVTITYANGVEQQVVDATTARATTLAWTIPADAGAGVANFALTTTGCGCGVRTLTQTTTTLEGKAEGQFRVQ
jgi:hypothetical protein